MNHYDLTDLDVIEMARQNERYKVLVDALLTDLDVIEMARQNERYKVLVDALFDNAMLYGENDLTIDQYHFVRVLKLIFPARYDLVVESLKKEKEANRNG